jgi:hypothetical protein
VEANQPQTIQCTHLLAIFALSLWADPTSKKQTSSPLAVLHTINRRKRSDPERPPIPTPVPDIVWQGRYPAIFAHPQSRPSSSLREGAFVALIRPSLRSPSTPFEAFPTVLPTTFLVTAALAPPDGMATRPRLLQHQQLPRQLPGRGSTLFVIVASITVSTAAPATAPPAAQPATTPAGPPMAPPRQPAAATPPPKMIDHGSGEARPFAPENSLRRSRRALQRRSSNH